MTPLTWFGNPWTWVLLLVAWLWCGVVFGLIFGVMANIEEVMERRKRR